MNIRHILQEHVNQLQKEIDTISIAAAKSPEGRLICHKAGKQIKWFRGLPESGKEQGKRSYIPKSERSLAEALAYKAVCHAILPAMRKEQKAAEKLLEASTHTAEIRRKVMSRNGFQELLFPEIPDAGSWSEESHEKSRKYPEALINRTTDKNLVRSKSEAFIYRTLQENNIRFRYECKLTLGDEEIYPDFIIVHPVTHKIIIWEHFGKSTDPEYMGLMLHKLRVYLKNGYIPFVNLIITFEDQEHPLDFWLVEEFVRVFLME